MRVSVAASELAAVLPRSRPPPKWLYPSPLPGSMVDHGPAPAQGPAGPVVATSADGSTFATASGASFAERIDDVFCMADGSVGRPIGAVMFVQNEAGEQVRA